MQTIESCVRLYLLEVRDPRGTGTFAGLALISLLPALRLQLIVHRRTLVDHEEG